MHMVRLVAALALAVGMLVAPTGAMAATFTVNSSSDTADASVGNGVCATAGGVCTVRAAVQEANATAALDIVNVGSRTVNVGAALPLSTAVRVVGTGPSSTILDGGGNDTVFLVTGTGADVRSLTVRNGSLQGGGGIFVDAGTLELQDARLTGNDGFTGGGGIYVDPGATANIRRSRLDANTATGAFGGAAWNNGTLRIYDSLLDGNSSNRAGAINSSGTLNVINSTISGNFVNSPDAGTGGIVNVGFAYLNNATITLNTGRGNNVGSFLGGGLLTASGATTAMKNSIIAGNDGVGGPPDCAGGAFSGDSRFNLIGNTTGCTLPANTSTWVLNQSAQLGALALNGATLSTHLPAAASPAVNAGSPDPAGGPSADACEGFDQRGIVRLDCDMGAAERAVTVPTTIVVNSTADVVDAIVGDGFCRTAGNVCTLRAAVQEANRLPGPQQVQLPAGTYGLSIPPAESGLDIARGGDLDLTDDELTTVTAAPGQSRDTVFIDGNDVARIFDVAPLAKATISGVTIGDGTDSGGGGIRLQTSELRLENSRVWFNSSSFAGGGIYVGGIDGVLTVTNTYVGLNTTTNLSGDGGGISGTGELIAVASQIASNTAAGSGGGLDWSGSGALLFSTVSANAATGGFGYGGGVSGSGLVVLSSTISGNTADRQGGGLFGSGIVLQSTISGNQSDTNGGGISTSGNLNVVNTTVASNSATLGGNGLHRFGASSVLRFEGGILSNPAGALAECAGLLPTSGGHNTARGATCGLAGAGDQQNASALLGPLADNGGLTLTHLPAANSPAVGHGSSAGFAADQRGMPRPVGLPDAGSVER